MTPANFVSTLAHVCTPLARFSLAVFLALFATAFVSSQQPAASQLSLDTLTKLRTPPQVFTGEATLVSHYAASPKLRLALALKPPHTDEEQQFLRDLQDKKSPYYHQFLTAEKWNARFSPSEQDEQAVIDWATSQGLTITHRYPNRLIVDVEGTVGALEQAFNVTINSYSLQGQSYFSNDRDPVVPANLSNIMISVQGLNNIQRMQTARRSAVKLPEPDYAPGPVVEMASPLHGNGSRKALQAAMAAKKKLPKSAGHPPITNGNYDPTDMYGSNAYDYNALQALGHCCNPNSNAGGSPPEASIGIAAFGSWAGSDIVGFGSQYPYLAYNFQPIYIDGTPGCCGDEVTLDSEWSMAMANSFGSYLDTAEVFVYEGANENNSTFTDMYNQMLSDGHARVFSTSWSCTEFYGCDSGTMDSRDAIFSSMVGQGWTLMAASGDRGTTDDCTNRNDVAYPASDPNVIGVGGTYLQLFNDSTYDYEVAWQGGTYSGACTHNNGGSGGGCSSKYAAPGYQSSPYCGSGSRSTPDISLNASHGQNYYYNGSLQGVGGTSISSPMLAGFFAQEDAYLLSLGNICGINNGTLPCAPMGNANWNMYYEGYNSNYAPHYPYYDITSGCNSNDITAFYGLGYYCAGTGYDAVTGWGTFNALQFAWMFNWSTAAASGPATISFGGPTTGVWYNSDQLLDWTVGENTGGFPTTGSAGYSQQWDFDPGDVFSEATPGQGNAFYSGPQHPNGTFGCTDLDGSLCTGGPVSQGCHTMHVRGWDNMGYGSGDNTYGPVCYDTVSPFTTDTLSGTFSGGVYISPVTVTLSATDPGYPSTGSGVSSTVFQLDGGAANTYAGAFAVSSLGVHTLQFHSTDVATNVESTKTVGFHIESTTGTTLSSSVNPSSFEQAVTFTAKVTGSFGGVPNGTVQFKDGASAIGSAALNGSGVAALPTTSLSLGHHTITAVYVGNTSFVGSTSAALTQTVNKAATHTTVTSSANPASYHQTITFTATVSSFGVPAGSVTFKDGATVLGTRTLNAAGVATISTNALAIGNHSITAVYAGNADFLASTSPARSQTINKASTKSAVASSKNPSTHGTAVTFTATVTPAFGGTATGKVTFKDGAAVLGTGTVNASNKATFTTSTLAVGTHNITAVYPGDTHFAGSTSAALKQVVK